MTKVYGVQGRTNVEITLQIGKARLPIEFTKGCMDRKCYRPATFTTADKTIQNMIEGSEYFGKLIKLYKVYGEDGIQDQSGDAEEPVQTAPAAKEERDEIKSFPDVTTIEQLRSKLKSLGAKATNLGSVPAMKKFIASKGLEFPNFTFEE